MLATNTITDRLLQQRAWRHHDNHVIWWRHRRHDPATWRSSCWPLVTMTMTMTMTPGLS